MIKNLLLAASACAAMAILLIVLEGTKGIALLGGLGMIVLIFWRPLVGMVTLIFLGTCFQIMGSAHLTGLPVSLVKIVGALTLASWLLQVIRKRQPLTYTPQLFSIAAFALVAMLSTLVQPDRSLSLVGLFKIGQVIVLFLLIANIAGENRKNLLIAGIALTVAMAVSGAIGILEFTLPQFAIESSDPRLAKGTLGGVLDRDSLFSGEIIKRVTGGIGEANTFSYSLAAVMPLFVFWWINFRKPWMRVLALLAVGLQFTGLLCSYTRTGFLGLFVAVLYLLARGRLPRARTLAVAAAAMTAAVMLMPASFAQRLFSLQYLKEGSTIQRRDFMLSAWELAKKRPLLGYGFGEFGPHFLKLADTAPFIREDWQGLKMDLEEGLEDEDSIGAHNLVLEVWVIYGLLGLVPFLLFLALIMRDLRLAERHADPMERDLAVCLGAGMVALYVTFMLHHVWVIKILWIIAGLCAALRRLVLSRAPGTAAA